MMLTHEQKAVVRYDGNTMLTACPGSGKTRVIVSKLLRVVDMVRDTPRAVACITYTNAAVYEIEARVGLHIQPGDDRYYDVGTIHSFCLNNIFRPFCHLIQGYSKGFKVLTPDNEEFQKCITDVYRSFGRHSFRYSD
jgi:DNA helicase II / ATP-dependent DNA helicase PcrA